MGINGVNQQPSFKGIKVIAGSGLKVSNYIEEIDKMCIHANQGRDTIVLDGEHMVDFFKSKYGLTSPDNFAEFNVKNNGEVQKFVRKNPEFIEKIQDIASNIFKFASDVIDYAKTKKAEGHKIDQINL